jgi:hypothetical protein
MRLVGIEPHHLPTSNDNIYTFECVVCGMTTAEAVSASTLTELMGDISLTVSPIKDARGKIASKIARDITERRKRYLRARRSTAPRIFWRTCKLPCAFRVPTHLKA